MSRAPELTFQQTIPRRLVHRAAVAEVFLTDAVALEDDHFVVAAQWPRDHALYHPDPAGRSDPLLFAETIRQALVYVAHRHCGVPLEHRFVGRDMHLVIDDPDALRVGGEPLPVVLDVRWFGVGNDSPRRRGMRIEAELRVAGVVCGRGGLSVVAVDESYYRRLRRRPGGVSPTGRHAGATGRLAGFPGGRVAGPPGRVAGSSVGRLREKDCVLMTGERPGEWLLAADLDHAILFDHPTDHVPLMVVLEGFRQLGHLLVNAAGTSPVPSSPTHSPAPSAGAGPHVLVSLDSACRAWAELDVPTRLVVRSDRGAGARTGVRELAVDAVQRDAVVMTSTMVWAPARTSSPAPNGRSSAESGSRP
ncbi:ScbA/BarX family gamma-butyrolactone biosynthesis protein [Streptomyces sp. NPDC046316]|uniref:ScbA/BarX family gamma-butyrolactone biosynthesis protein n=1 Tax=Streptomyces sp. NPDC046316 TaxID=3154494 RepID=UPI0033FC3445